MRRAACGTGAREKARSFPGVIAREENLGGLAVTAVEITDEAARTRSARLRENISRSTCQYTSTAGRKNLHLLSARSRR